ncbi:MAG: HlyD family efflux transporter periplasmic adaptor subunit, partial [Rhodospirillales bacterium]|nr:HlyD family efflux transporter periplasmic adaptor subunit [Rhodospirillales bacterium]
ARIDPTTFEAKVREAKADLEVARAQVVSQQAAVVQARANVQNARATIASTEADLVKAQINLKDMQLDLKRKRDLKVSGAVALSALDKAEATYDTAVAQVSSARALISAQQSMIGAREAALVQAEAEVGHAQAQAEQKAAVLYTANVSLDNTFIRSPVNGVVIGRNVDVGTVVAASLSSPTLFSIARDLRSMQVEASIDEADIGQIQPGQTAIFTVDSFLGQEFQGHVVQVRKQPLEQQSVITYTVVISADNPDLRLLPGMTANVEIRVSDRANVLKVPSAALRFRPPDDGAPVAAASGAPGNSQGPRDPAQQREQFERFAEQLGLDDEQKRKVREINTEMQKQARVQRQSAKGEATKGEGSKGEGKGAPQGAPKGEMQADASGAQRNAMAAVREQTDKRIMEILRPDQQQKFHALLLERRENPSTPARVWVLDDGKPKAVPIAIGVADATHTELVRGDIAEGHEIIIGLNRAQKGSGTQPQRRFGF